MSKVNSNKNKDLNEKIIKDLTIKIKKLSYEKSLEELDIILNNLQDENILVEELKYNYIKANLYIQHCESLLSKIEQEVVEIDPKELESFI